MIQVVPKINIVLCLALITAVLHKETNAQNTCDSFEWKCKNGQCIASDELCDGEAQCRDKSDETAESCVHVLCPKFAFRCAYGACVSGDAECNGQRECFDNSDETSIFCPGVLDSLSNHGNCSEESFQCKSGECISGEEVCDGRADCTDGSDETVERCAATLCPTFAFRCWYGACINGNAKCDGIEDCHDGSDEARSLCPNRVGPPKKPTPSTSSSTTTTTTSTTHRPPEPSNSKDCRVPSIPNLLVSYASGQNEFIAPGEYVPEQSSVKYSCDSKYSLEGARQDYCVNGEWIVTPAPSCIRYCSKVDISRISIKADCEYMESSISCNDNIRPGTLAKISCQVGYRKPNRQVTDVLRCDSDGQWDFHPFRCEQICGLQPVDSTPFILHGEQINITKVPWHAAIYYRDNGKYQQICGGTIINAKIIISAAHCFWDSSNNRLQDKALFAVGVGKYKSSYHAQEPLEPQFFNVSEIHVPDSYLDAALYYQNDIAILVLNNFIRFASYIRPICIEWLPSNNRSIPSGIFGRVAGWGRDENNVPSPVLKIADLPTVGPSECLANTRPEYKELITGDKFCVNNSNGETVCDGDSGGGFFTMRTLGDNIQYAFLLGIVSTGLKPRGDCSGNILTTFTNIHEHSKTITNYETRYRPK